jgi:thioredoxin reductase (NADPH)
MENDRNMDMEHINCLIIGGGPAGYTAAIYATRAALSPVLYEGNQPGGQLTTTTVVENYPGFPKGVDANQLMADMREQAVNLGADIRRGVVTAVDLGVRPFRLTVDGEKELEADAVIIATGATARYLGLPSEEKFRGLGVSACATCDGFFYRKKDVAVVGGGDTACEEATYLAGLCRKVYMIVRRDVLRASVAMQERVKNTPNIEILWNCNTQEVLGDASGVTGARLLRKDGEVFDIQVDGFFLAIGHHPESELFAPWVAVDEAGYILTEGGSSRTSVEGVFAAGDVQDPHYRQAVNAAASGCRAALDAEKYLKR